MSNFEKSSSFHTSMSNRLGTQIRLNTARGASAGDTGTYVVEGRVPTIT
jgi:hypothetical protein